MGKLRKHKVSILNIFIIFFLLALPYYLFAGKLYLGGDDTRLFYSYPLEFFKTSTFFSWYKFSSLGINGPSQYMVPFLLWWSLLGLIISKVSMNYLALSLPLILGLLYFQKAFKEIFNLKGDNEFEVFLGSLFYVLSPILIINQLFVFLISIWLIGYIPIISYYYLKYLRTSNFLFVFIASLWSLFFAQAVYSIPWLAGFLLPVLLGLIFVSVLFKKKDIVFFFKNSIVFFGFIFISQAFWLTSFVSTYLNLGQNSFSSKFLSKGFLDTFTPTILSTATGNVMYPLLNVFHRQIVFDFKWNFISAYTNFYDKIIILNVFFLFIFTFGVLKHKKYLDNFQRKLFLLILVSFIFSLYFFTVNIGLLLNIFIFLRHIPGFVMFRNFYDKFAPGYVILYSVLITVGLIIYAKYFPKIKTYFLIIFFLITVINFMPVKTIVDSPLWTTKDIGREIIIPKEYLNFMDYINKNVSSSNNILSIPFGSSVYTVIKDSSSNNVYVGVSPVKLFSGVNDISGHLSFNFTKEANVIDGIIAGRKYNQLNSLMFEHNINYVLVTRNIPQEVLNAWVFNKNMVDTQDAAFLEGITSKKIAESSRGNYELYQAKKVNSLINSENVYFKKISQVEYVIYLKGIKNNQELSFLDSYHPGWKLFLQKNPSLSFCSDPVKNSYTGVTECKAENRLFDISDLGYSFISPVFDNTHDLKYDYANKWTIDPGYIKSNVKSSYYKVNKDGSIDMELVLYFVPQNYFYFGSIISILTFISGGLYLLYLRLNEKHKK